MVMATGSVYQQVGGPAHEMGEEKEQTSSDAIALHERLVAYVHALAGGHEPRCGVWVEHSYARARGAAAGPTHSVRVLLAPRPAADAAPLDVERLEPAPPDLPDDHEALRLLADDDADSEPDDDWEARVMAAAPTTAHARLADAVLDILRRARLELLAGGRAGEALRTAARRLRLALAAPPMAAAPPAPAAWLQAQLPRGPRRLYEAVLARLRRAAPRLAERATGSQGPAATDGVLSAAGASVGEGGASAPWLLWVSCGHARQDQRWLRRLGALLHTRLVAGGAGAGGGAGGAALTPEAWCGAAAGGLRAALSAALGAAGERPVVLGGAGAGATLAAGLAGGTRARALVLLAPALVTAEGAREAAEEARVPTLVVSGAGGAQCWRGAAREMSRRVLELRGADDWLRLPARARRRRRLPQDAVDAAVADECARWILDVALGAGGGAPGGAGAGARRREGRGLLRALGPAAAPDDDEDFAHLPSAAPAPGPPGPAAPPGPPGPPPGPQLSVSERGGDAALVSRGGDAALVSRGCGATPLALLPPRRRASAGGAGPGGAGPGGAGSLGAADIMRLPIVFADDEAALEPPEAGASPVTVTSGSRYTRVIVASRGPVRPGRGPPGRSVGPVRPVLLRRALRLVPSNATPPQ